MGFEIVEATTREEREAVFRFRYRIYVQEMGWHGRGDHERGWVRDEEDETGRIFCARSGAEIVGTVRVNWGGDGPFTQAQTEELHLQPFIDLAGRERLATISRCAVSRAHRGGALFFQLMVATCQFMAHRRCCAGFIDSEPHLLGAYERVGWRRCGKAYNDSDGSLLVPLVFAPDMEHLERIGSPLAEVARQALPQPRLPAVLRLIDELSREAAGGSFEEAARAAQARLLRERAQASAGASLCDELSPEDLERLLARSYRIRCSKGTTVIRKDHVTRTLFLVLSGTVEERRGSKVVRYARPGDGIGENALLRGLPRVADATVASAEAELAAIGPRTLDEIVEREPALAARFFRNLSRSLSFQLAQASGRGEGHSAAA